MKSLPPVSSTAHHGGNGYRGLGAWERPPRERPFAVSKGPLDLGRILGNLDRDRGLHKQKHATKNRSKQGQAAALRARLESLSLTLAPSYGVSEPAPSVKDILSAARHRRVFGDGDPSVLPGAQNPCQQESEPLPEQRTLPPAPQGQQQQLQQKNRSAGLAVPFDSDRNPTSHENAVAMGKMVVVDHRHTSRGDDSQLPDFSSRSSTGNQSMAAPRSHAYPTDALRIPNAATRMTVDDRCSSEVLGARAKLRALLSEQKELRDAMQRRRVVTCLGNGGKSTDSAVRRRCRKPMGHAGRQRGRRNGRLSRLLKEGSKEQEEFRSAAMPRFHAHPLVFMAEEDVQRIEVDQMRLEDAEATYLLKLEEARLRRKDYATYYHLAVRYGPLSKDEFELATYPGRHYHGKVLDATRAIQNWWWSVWPRLLRRRKAAALTIQSVFRGFLQRRKWYAIIRLRTLWGTTRIVAHSFLVWRGAVTLVRRVRAFTRRFRNRIMARCFEALANIAAETRRSREELLLRALRRASEGIRMRVFESWLRYTEVSMTVKRLRFRSSARQAFRAWRKIASQDRMCSRLRWACATLISRWLRWKKRSQYVKLQGSCVKAQIMARKKIAWIRVKRKVRESRLRRAEEAIQALEDVKVRHLIDVERQRLKRLQAAIDQDSPSARKNAISFLKTAAGKTAVANRLAMLPPSTESEAEAKREIVRLFMRRAQAPIRHDFNAMSPPPPLRCPRSDCCDATFVDRGHCLRHAADVHPTDAPEVAELSAAMRDAAGLAVFEEFIETATVSIDGPGNGSLQADPGRQEETSRILPPGNENKAAAPSSADDGVAAVRDTLDMWKAIEQLKKVPISSERGRFQELGASILDHFGSGPATKDNRRNSTHPNLPDDVKTALSGETALHVLGKLEERHRTSNDKSIKGLLGGKRRKPTAAELPSSSSSSKAAVDPSALEEASARAALFLGESTAGRAFLRSAKYTRYLDGLYKPTREAMREKAAEIAAAEAAGWAAEARGLREAAINREKEALIDSLADQASNLALHGGAGSVDLLGGLVDDQASRLAVVILAERSTFARVIASVWNEAVDDAARLAALELREVDPRVSDALSDAACSLARSRIMDEMIDQCAVDLTGPEGELWADARTMAAVADGVGYRVRCDVMSELIDTAVAKLAESGAVAEALMIPQTRRTSKENGVGGSEDDDGHDAGVGGTVLSGVSGESAESGLATALRTPSSRALPPPDAANAHQPGPGMDGDSDHEHADDGEEVRDISDRRDRGGVVAEVQAAILVQSVMRRKAVYREMKTLVARNFVRLYDPGERAFYWYNQATMESTWEKPAIIDLYFKRPAVSKSLLYLGEESASGGKMCSSTVSGFESSVCAKR